MDTVGREDRGDSDIEDTTTDLRRTSGMGRRKKSPRGLVVFFDTHPVDDVEQLFFLSDHRLLRLEY